MGQDRHHFSRMKRGIVMKGSHHGAGGQVEGRPSSQLPRQGKPFVLRAEVEACWPGMPCVCVLSDEWMLIRASLLQPCRVPPSLWLCCWAER